MNLSKSLVAHRVAVLVACALLPWQASAALLVSPDGTTVYDTATNVSWLVDANLAATNRFGLPVCPASGGAPCVNPSGSMSYASAAAWIAAMNAANYLGHNNWQLPTTPITDNGCGKTGPQGNSFGFGCTLNALGSLYYNALGLKAPDTAVSIPNNTVGPFSNFQPYLYWSQSPGQGGNATLSFNNGFQGANTVDNFLYALPMIAGKIPGTPPASGNGLEINPGGQTVYDPVTNVTWLSNANLAATDPFGLPPCISPTSPSLCVNQDGAMTLASANQFIANMNGVGGTGYLNQTNWELPPMESCTGYNCADASNPLTELFFSQLGLSPGTPVVAAPNIAVGPFHNIQPYLYWSCEAATIQNACQTAGPATNFEWSFSFGNGFLGTDLLANEFYVTAYFVGPPSSGPCTYSFSSGGQLFSPQGGLGSITITTGAGCPWTVGALPSWVMLTGPSAGLGSGTVTFQILPDAGGDLSGSFTIAGQTFTIGQEAASIPGLTFIGSMPHLAAEDGWNTTFTLVNKSAASVDTRSSLFTDLGGPLTLPLTFPQQPSTAGPVLGASLDQTLAANASFIVEASGPDSAPLAEGSAQIAATGTMDGFAIFHYNPTNQEAVVPLETRNAPSYLLAFDNTNSVLTGIAIENISTLSAAIPVVLRNDAGTQIGAGSISLNGGGHTSFVLSTQFPVTANIRGTAEFDTPAGAQISVLGIRYTPPGTLTTIPALANVGVTGGSTAHLASGDGWETTFVLVNTGTSAAQALLNFFDDNGQALPLPLTFPQNNGAPTTVAIYSYMIAAGASLWIQSAGPLASPLLTGSAQLTTTGNVSGFVIFRYNPNGQEAVVPIENRNAAAYLLAFDNTNGTATGIAVSAVSSQEGTVSVILRDDTGNQIVTAPITLAPNGHYSQGLTTLLPATAGIRGTVEFDAPANAQISVIGIRSPPALTFTTLPSLAK
jgi:hypothetical protein